MTPFEINTISVALLVRFLSRRGEWRGSPGDLADELWEAARPGEYPPERNVIVRFLEMNAEALQKNGISWDTGRSNRGRWIALRKVD